MTSILRYAAFTETPEGGNPAGVVLDASDLSADEMQRIAKDVGYSESAFVTKRDQPGKYDVRYFSPDMEVPFCGHATIATAVALAQRDGAGPLTFHTQAGEIPIDTTPETATLTSVTPRMFDIEDRHYHDALKALRWDEDDLDKERFPVLIAYAGARHLILAAKTRERLADLDYDFEALKAVMQANDLITVDLVYQESETTYHARNPFPVGGVVEDPATGAAAAAFGGYLRATKGTQGTITVHQGVDMGRPSELTVEIGPHPEGIRVSGRAVAM